MKPSFLMVHVLLSPNVSNMSLVKVSGVGSVRFKSPCSDC